MGWQSLVNGWTPHDSMYPGPLIFERMVRRANAMSLSPFLFLSSGFLHYTHLIPFHVPMNCFICVPFKIGFINSSSWFTCVKKESALPCGRAIKREIDRKR